MAKAYTFFAQKARIIFILTKKGAWCILWVHFDFGQDVGTKNSAQQSVQHRADDRPID